MSKKQKKQKKQFDDDKEMAKFIFNLAKKGINSFVVPPKYDTVVWEEQV